MSLSDKFVKLCKSALPLEYRSKPVPRSRTYHQSINRRTVLTLPIFGALSALFSQRVHAASGEVTISPVNPTLQAEIDAYSQLGKEFVEQYLGKKEQYTLVEIDAAIQNWRASDSLTKVAPQTVIERVGAFFGDFLVTKLQLEWAIYSDARGEDLCVVHRKLSVFSFPHSAIFKAATQGREDALPLIEQALAQQISEAQRNQDVMPR